MRRAGKPDRDKVIELAENLSLHYLLILFGEAAAPQGRESSYLDIFFISMLDTARRNM
jgi:hypothetical protein